MTSINLASIDRAAAAHVADLIVGHGWTAAAIAAESSLAALETWNRCGILAAAGLPASASDDDLDRARAALASAIRADAAAR